jgi:hypothetical protein
MSSSGQWTGAEALGGSFRNRYSMDQSFLLPLWASTGLNPVNPMNKSHCKPFSSMYWNGKVDTHFERKKGKKRKKEKKKWRRRNQV